MMDELSRPNTAEDIASESARLRRRAEALARALQRERRGRERVEELLEKKTRDLYLASEKVKVQFAYLSNVLKSIADCIILTDSQGRIRSINDATLRLSGYTEDDLVAQPIDRLIALDDDMPHPDGSWCVDAYDSGRITEHVFVRKDGSRLTVSVSCAVVLDSAGRVDSRVISARDITERKRTEEELLKLSNVVRQTADAVFITDKDGAIEYVNPAFEEITGYSRNEAIGATPRILKSGEHEEAFYETLWSTVLAGQVYHSTLINKKKNGDLYYSEKTITPLKDTEGNIVHFVSTDRDITERKLLETQIVQSEKMASIGQLAAGVAHEINNPVGFIMSNLGTLQEYVGSLKKILAQYEALAKAVEPVAGDEAADSLDKIETLIQEEDLDYILEDVDELLKESLEGTERVKEIVQSLKNFARAEEIELKEADINEGIEATLKVVWNELKYKAEVHKRLGKIPRVLCYPGQLNQVFMNLLVNAVQSIPEKGEITIETKVVGSDAIVRISDTGVGIPERDLHRIFDPFFTTKEVGRGTGLGLSISHSIVQKHNGSIHVDSKVGQGTTFTIRLPIREMKHDG